MEYFVSAQLAALLAGNLATAAIVADPAAPKGVAFKNTAEGGGCAAGHAVHWLHIEDQEASVREDVAKIASHELVAVRCQSCRRARALRPAPAAHTLPPPHTLSL
jgi:carbonic anhydrase